MKLHELPMTYDDRLTAEQRKGVVHMREAHYLHVHNWNMEAFLAWVEYHTMFVGAFTKVDSEGTIVYGNRRRTLSYNGHVTETETALFLHDPDVGPTGAQDGSIAGPREGTYAEGSGLSWLDEGA